MDGQMSIFDFPKFLPDKECPKCSKTNECEAYPEGCNGTIEPCTFGGPFKWKINSIEENEILCGKYYQETICQYSNHKCNKEELWKIANTLDGITCNKVCCRNCDVRLCGARCNGSDEPLQPALGKTVCDHDHKAMCNRYGPNNVQFQKAKEDLPKGFACAGCCWYCSQAPMHGGKCKFDCRYYKE